MSTKRCWGFFLFCLDLELFVKIKKDLISIHLLFTFSLITQDLNKINFVAVGARQSFQFFRKIASFIGNNKALSKFRYRILHNLISISNL